MLLECWNRERKEEGHFFFPVEFLSGSAMKACAMMSAQLLPNNNRCSKGIKHIKRNTRRKKAQNIEGGLLLPTLLLLKCFQGETTLATGGFEGSKKLRKPNKKVAGGLTPDVFSSCRAASCINYREPSLTN